MIPRADLLEILADEAGGHVVRESAKCVAFGQDAEAVTVELEDGQRVWAMRSSVQTGSSRRCVPNSSLMSSPRSPATSTCER